MAKKNSGNNGSGGGGDDNDKVGYGRPPKHSRIKPGEVRNPFGRNGRPRKDEDLFGKAINKPTRVTIDGESVMMTSEEAFYMRTMAMALAGNIGAIRIIEKRLAQRERLKPAGPTAEERAQEAAELEEKKRLAAKLVGLLQDAASRKKAQAPRVRPRAPGQDKDPDEGQEAA